MKPRSVISRNDLGQLALAFQYRKLAACRAIYVHRANADTENLDAFMRVMESKATADAMACDGVKRETVKLVVFDKEFKV